MYIKLRHYKDAQVPRQYTQNSDQVPIDAYGEYT